MLRRHTLVKKLVKLFPEQRWQRFRADDFEIVGNLHEAAVIQAMLFSHFEDYGYFSLAASLLEQGGIHFDLGANYGFHTFGLLNRVKKSAGFHLFEPNAEACECHRLSAQLYPESRFFHNQIAMGDSEGSVSFTMDPSDSGGGSIFSREADFPLELQGGRTVSVIPMTTLDSYITKSLPAESIVTLMKMDVEGSEVAVVRGGSKWLPRGRIKAIYSEVNKECLRWHQTTPTELLQILKDYGFSIFFPHSKVNRRVETIDVNGVTLRLTPIDLDIDIIPREKDTNDCMLFDILALHKAHFSRIESAVEPG